MKVFKIRNEIKYKLTNTFVFKINQQQISKNFYYIKSYWNFETLVKVFKTTCRRSIREVFRETNAAKLPMPTINLLRTLLESADALSASGTSFPPKSSRRSHPHPRRVRSLAPVDNRVGVLLETYFLDELLFPCDKLEEICWLGNRNYFEGTVVSLIHVIGYVCSNIVECTRVINFYKHKFHK